ncbi:hypothetical protein Tco_1549284 [Tanacetum coccineum]
MPQISKISKKRLHGSYRQLHSHLKLLSHDKLKGTRTESGFKRAFATLFGQDVKTFIGTITSRKTFSDDTSITEEFILDDEFVVMTRNYFLQYTQLSIPEFRDTLIQHVESVKKSIDERALHKREYDTRVNERQIQITKGKVDTGKALDASLVNTESNGTESKSKIQSEQMQENDAHEMMQKSNPI